MTLKRCLSFLGLLFALLAIQKALTYSEFVRAMQLKGYGFLQTTLDYLALGPSDRAVVVVDISHLPPDPTTGVTPRPALSHLLSKLNHADAKAIGVDIDFSPPDGEKFVDPKQDPTFFKSCMELGIPVFLGVARAAGGSRDRWLGEPEFAGLAAAITIPGDTGTIAKEGAPTPYPVYIPRLASDVSAEPSRSDDLRSLGVALASASGKDFARDLMKGSYFFESIAKRAIVVGQDFPEFTVDTSFVPDLQETRIEAKWDKDLNVTNSFDKHVVGGSLVFVGDLKGASQADIFDTAGTTKKTSGVLLHASAAMTLLKGRMSVFNEPTRIAMDVLFTVLAVGGAILIKKRYGHDLDSRPWMRFVGVPFLMFISIAFVTTCVAMVLVKVCRILWLDWMLVIVSIGVIGVTEEPIRFVTNWLESGTSDKHAEAR